jgi:hypothetical protein
MLLLIRKKTADRHERNLNQDRPAPQAKTDFSMSRGKKDFWVRCAAGASAHAGSAAPVEKVFLLLFL